MLVFHTVKVNVRMSFLISNFTFFQKQNQNVLDKFQLFKRDIQ